MKITILVVVESDNGDQVVQEVAQIERSVLQPENLGLSLAEAKTLLQTTQRTLVEQQVAEYEKKPCLEAKKLCKMLEEFRTYISNNGAYIPNYGERWRYGEAISTGFVESTVNQLISKRFVKKQQMRWTPVGAYLLLQVRTLVLNGELHDKFQQWYPGLADVNLSQSL